MMKKRSISLCFIIVWSLSTARSFQPATTSSSSSSTHGAGTTIHKDLATPLKVSVTTSGSGARRLLQDWANKVAPVNEISSNNHNYFQSHTTTKSALNIYDPSSNYQRAKEEWANRYTNVDSLRETFGSNRNKIWGDLDAATTRRLYKTLLPTALLELVKVGVKPEDLAPLAYQARVAAKLYARERCQVPARIFCQLFDGFRQWKKYGKFQPCGMSYDQVWEKYHDQLVAVEHRGDNEKKKKNKSLSGNNHDDLTEEDVTAMICLKILERSCTTNESIDKWVLPPNDLEQREDLARITQTLENDVRKLLDPVQQAKRQQQHASLLPLRKYRTLRLVARARRRATAAAVAKQQQQHHHHHQKVTSSSSSSTSSTSSAS